MASNKRKQDEKHLKMLREMVALPHNKQCFDCHQRGPTYVNMTIASFVCTSCSGLLRGLNPPHRVKSISMTSFTTEEMEFLRSRGNDFCRKVWLGLYDSRLHNEPESKDENKRKDFMSQKYEKKRWYVEPTASMYEDAKIQNTPPKQPDTKQLRSLGNTFPSLKVTQKPQQQQVPKPVTAPPQPSQTVQSPVQNLPTPRQGPSQARLPAAQPQNTQPQRSAGFDLLEDFGDSDPFAVTNQPAAPCPSTGEGFADFANFSSLTSPPASQPPAFPGQPLTSPASATGVLQPVGSAPQQAPPGLNLLSSGTTTTTSSTAAISQGDRYAALADLDTVFGGGTTGGQTVNWDGSYGSAFGGSTNNASGGANVGWDGSAPVSSVGGWSSNSSGTSGTVQSSGSNTIIGGFPGPGNTTTATGPFYGVTAHSNSTNPFKIQPAANPFGGNPPASSPVVGNPFAGTGQPISTMNQFGQTPTSAPTASFGQFGSTTNSIAPGVASTGGQFSAVQNGGFGLPQAQTGWPVGTQGQVNAFSGAPGANMNYNSPANMGQGQYMKMGQPAFASGQPQQQFGGWGGQPVGNPFMNVNAQQAVPPRGSSTNPFL